MNIYYYSTREEDPDWFKDLSTAAKTKVFYSIINFNLLCSSNAKIKNKTTFLKKTLNKSILQ